MNTVAQCLIGLKDALLRLNGGLPLNQNYDQLSNYDDAMVVKSFVDYIAKNPQFTFEQLEELNNPDDVIKIKRYQKAVLQAAWNVADILENINYENSYLSPSLNLTVVGRNLFNKGPNSILNKNNIINSLIYIDANKKVPYIFDEVTLGINLAIDTFVENMKKVPQGKALIDLSASLSDISSFIDMQQEAKARIAQYEAYLLIQHEESKTDYESSSINSQEIINERTVFSTPDIDFEDDDIFYDTKEGIDDSYVHISSLDIPCQTGNIHTTIFDEDDLDEYYDVQNNSPAAPVIDPEVEIKASIRALFDEFKQASQPRLLQRIQFIDTYYYADTEQRVRCEAALNQIIDIDALLANPDATLQQITDYIKGQNVEIIFSQNRSQTWFRKYIAEPFELFKRGVNALCKSVGLEDVFTPSTTHISKAFRQFKDRLPNSDSSSPHSRVHDEDGIDILASELTP